jgi:hypothetical protein
MTRTTTILALVAGAAAVGAPLPSSAMAAGKQSTAATAAKGIPTCAIGFTRRTVTTDRFTLAGCLKDLTDPINHALTGWQAKGAVTLDGVSLTPQVSTSILTLNKTRTVLGHTVPASLSSAGWYDVTLEGAVLGSFVPNISSVATASGVSTLAATADAAGTYDCSFKPKAGAKIKGFEFLASVLEVRCTVTPTGLSIGGTVKLPSQLTAGVDVGADLDVSIDSTTGLIQTGSVRLLDTPLPLGPLVTEQIQVTYNRALNRWIGSADVHEGANGALFQGRLGHFHAAIEIDVNPFRVRRLETDVKTPSLLIVGQGLGPALMLNRIGFNYLFSGTSWTLGGVIGLQGSINVPGSTLPMSVVSVDGTFQVTVPTSPTQPYVFQIGGDADFSQGWGALSASLASGTASITYATNGRLSFHGSVTGGFGQLPLIGDVAGITTVLDGSLTASSFSATGTGSAFVNVPGIGRFEQEGARVSMTSKGFGFCVLGTTAHYARTWNGAENYGLGCDLSSIN